AAAPSAPAGLSSDADSETQQPYRRSPQPTKPNARSGSETQNASFGTPVSTSTAKQRSTMRSSEGAGNSENYATTKPCGDASSRTASSNARAQSAQIRKQTNACNAGKRSARS